MNNINSSNPWTQDIFPFVCVFFNFFHQSCSFKYTYLLSSWLNLFQIISLFLMLLWMRYFPPNILFLMYRNIINFCMLILNPSTLLNLISYNSFFGWIFMIFFFFFYFKILQYCISFAKYRNESATGIPVFPILNPPPSLLPIPSLWVVPVHQPQASSIVYRTWTGDSFHTWYYTCFNDFLYIRYHLQIETMESKKIMQTNVYAKQKETHRYREQISSYQRKEGRERGKLGFWD